MTEELGSLLKKYFAGEASAEEKKKVLLWLASVKDEQIVKRMMESDWEEIVRNEEREISNSPKLWNSIQDNLQQQNSPFLPTNGLVERKPKEFNFSMLLKVAAMVIISIGVAYIIFSRVRDLKHQAEGLITKVAPANAQIRFRLSDGSTVYLNKGSKLSYYKDFSPRDVILEGEGFFEIKKDPKNPFQVHTSKLTVKVLGTHFNVSSYASNPDIEVYLSEGSVSILEKNQEYILKPGEMAVFNKQTTKIKIENADADSIMAWTGRKLIFKNAPLPIVLKKLEKRYSISTRIVGPVDKNCLFNAVIENDSLSTVLELIKISSNSTYTIKGDSVIVYPGRCK